MQKATTILFLAIALFLSQESFSQTSGSELKSEQEEAASRNSTRQKATSIKKGLTQPFVLKRQSSACDTITTLFARDNSLDGAMFDVVAHTDISINFLISNLTAGGDFDIYYKGGSYLGFENDSLAWTLAGSTTVVANPINDPTVIPITLNLVVNAGDTMGFYLVSANTGSLAYTDAIVGVHGDEYSDNGDLSILIGDGVSSPFKYIFGPRIWNGIIDYCQGTTAVSEIKNNVASVYPNPFHEFATFTFQENQNRKIEIFNSTGKLVKKIDIQNSVYKLMRDDLANGIYTYRISSEDGQMQSGRFIIR